MLSLALTKAAAASHETPDTQPVHQAFITTNAPHCKCKPLIAATMIFFTYVKIIKIYIYTYLMALTRKRTFAPRPYEAKLAEDKSVHDRINFDLDI
jgi:hypothetical protein